MSLARALDWFADNIGNALFIGFAAIAIAGLGLGLVAAIASLV